MGLIDKLRNKFKRNVDFPINYYDKHEKNYRGYVNHDLKEDENGHVYLEKSINVKKDLANTKTEKHEKFHYKSTFLRESYSPSGDLWGYDVNSGFMIFYYNKFLNLVSERGRAANEGATDFLALQETFKSPKVSQKDIDLFNTCKYQTEVVAMGAVSNAIGIEKFQELYESADREGLADAADSIMGRGYYSELEYTLGVAANGSETFPPGIIPSPAEIEKVKQASSRKAEKMGFDIWAKVEKNRFIQNIKNSINSGHIEYYIKDICREGVNPNIHPDSNYISSSKKLNEFKKQIDTENRMYANSLYMDAKGVPPEKRTANLVALNLFQEEYIEGSMSLEDIRNTTFTLSSNPKLENMLFINRNGKLEINDVEMANNNGVIQDQFLTSYMTRDLSGAQDLTEFEKGVSDVITNYYSNENFPDKNSPQILTIPTKPDLYFINDEVYGLNVLHHNREHNALEIVEVEQPEKLHGIDAKKTVKDRALSVAKKAKSFTKKAIESVGSKVKTVVSDIGTR